MAACTAGHSVDGCNREIERTTFRTVTLSPRFLSVTSYNNQIGQIQIYIYHSYISHHVHHVKFHFERNNNNIN